MIENYESEQTVLGILLFDGTIVQQSKLEQDHFHRVAHQTIYKAIMSVAEQGTFVDLQSVVAELVRLDQIKNVGGVSYLSELAGAIPTSETFGYHENLVFEAYRARESRKLAMQYAENPTDESLAELSNNLESLQSVGITQREMTTNEHLEKIIDEMTQPKEASETGLPTGYTDLDRMTGGWQNGDLIIVAARPSVGKTAFALNLADAHCSNGGTSHVFSLEMGTGQLLKRMISAKGNVDGQKWRTMAFTSNDYENAIKSVGIMSNWNLEIYEKSNTIKEIVAEIRKSVQDNPDGKHLVVIDYLQLIVPTGKHERRDLEIGAMTRTLKLLAKDLEIPIVLLSQLSRSVEQRQDKRPMMSDLRESGNIEQDADIVGFLYRDDYYDSGTEKQNIIEIILSKQRNGPIGTVELYFLKEYGKFCNLDHRYSN